VSASQSAVAAFPVDPSGPVQLSSRGAVEASATRMSALAERIGKAQPFPVTFQ
jgi:hypothetical protein